MEMLVFAGMVFAGIVQSRKDPESNHHLLLQHIRRLDDTIFIVRLCECMLPRTWLVHSDESPSCIQSKIIVKITHNVNESYGHLM